MDSARVFVTVQSLCLSGSCFALFRQLCISAWYSFVSFFHAFVVQKPLLFFWAVWFVAMCGLFWVSDYHPSSTIDWCRRRYRRLRRSVVNSHAFHAAVRLARVCVLFGCDGLAVGSSALRCGLDWSHAYLGVLFPDYTVGGGACMLVRSVL